MQVYRISSEKYAKKLAASGAANRWNRAGEFVIYTASSRSLASLELVVHRTAINVKTNYKVMVIDINVPKSQLETVDLSMLPKKWRSLSAYPKLQKMGSEWYSNRKKLVLRIPSAVIPQEYNFAINTEHDLFKSKVKLVSIEDYFWDERLL